MTGERRQVGSCGFRGGLRRICDFDHFEKMGVEEEHRTVKDDIQQS